MKKELKPVIYILHEGVDYTFDERNNTALIMRKVQWGNEGDEPNTDKAKLELRKWLYTEDGKERPNKGFSFLTEQGPHNLADLLVEQGFGDTDKLLAILKNRK